MAKVKVIIFGILLLFNTTQMTQSYLLDKASIDYPYPHVISWLTGELK